MKDNPRQFTPEQAFQRAIGQILDGLLEPGLDPTATDVARVLYELAKSGQLTWPLAGRELANIVGYCVGEEGLGVRVKTPKIMRELVSSGVLMNMALSDWYRPGPKFNEGRGHHERP